MSFRSFLASIGCLFFLFAFSSAAHAQLVNPDSITTATTQNASVTAPLTQTAKATLSVDSVDKTATATSATATNALSVASLADTIGGSSTDPLDVHGTDSLTSLVSAPSTQSAISQVTAFGNIAAGTAAAESTNVGAITSVTNSITHNAGVGGAN